MEISEIIFIHEKKDAGDDSTPPINDEVYSHDEENAAKCFDDDDSKHDFIDFPLDEIARNAELRIDLAAWSMQHNISHNALKDLIAIINKASGKELLPKDPRTLLQTPRTVKIDSIGTDQQYWHNGLKICLENVFADISKSITVSLNFNMDGLPIFESTSYEFWPILCNITEMPSIRPMVVGIYYGKAKASNLKGYLQPMVDELKSICDEGIDLNGYHITVKIRSFICDSPARAFIKGMYCIHRKNTRDFMRKTHASFRLFDFFFRCCEF